MNQVLKIGSGPPVLLLPSGAQGDVFLDLAELLANEFTVVSALWPAAGNAAGSSPHSVQRLADEAAGLIELASVGPVAVYGHNGGGTVALELLLRHPHLLCGLVLHDPPLVCLLQEPGPGIAQLDRAMSAASRGRRAMQEAFLRTQEPGLGEHHAGLLDRLLDGAGPLLTAEAEVLAGYRPDLERLATTGVPLLALHGATSPGHHKEICRRLAGVARGDVLEVPWGHWSFLDDVSAFLDIIRPFLRTAHHI
jgi:pimeloyl-ACP methyl ester carboxylesterase